MMKKNLSLIVIPGVLLLVSTDYVSYYPVWRAGRSGETPFVIKGIIHYPEETILYLFCIIIFSYEHDFLFSNLSCD